MKRKLSVPMCAVLMAAVWSAENSSAADKSKDALVITRKAVVSDKSPDAIAAEIERSGITPASKMPMLNSLEQLPKNIRQLIESKKNSGQVSPQAWGDGMFPFTTARAISNTKNDTAYLKRDLARGIGKLWMRFGTSWYTCTASIIDKGLIVTAAHCVHNYGEGDAGWADEVLFQPMRDSSEKPYGTWKGKDWTIPTVYYDGTDTCAEGAEGVICENDLAVVAIAPKDGYYVGKKVFPSTDTAHKSYSYGYYGEYSYIPLYVDDNYLGYWGAQLTQFGYPAAMESGLRMLRTDSLGIMTDPYNVVIGSDQSGGSSGGPWMVNYGRPYSSTDSVPYENEMAIMAVTSWGYTDDTIKLQGASRFSTNSTFTDVTNIDALHDYMCVAYPAYCY